MDQLPNAKFTNGEILTDKEIAVILRHIGSFRSKEDMIIHKRENIAVVFLMFPVTPSDVHSMVFFIQLKPLDLKNIKTNIFFNILEFEKITAFLGDYDFVESSEVGANQPSEDFITNVYNGKEAVFEFKRNFCTIKVMLLRNSNEVHQVFYRDNVVIDENTHTNAMNYLRDMKELYPDDILSLDISCNDDLKITSISELAADFSVKLENLPNV